MHVNSNNYFFFKTFCSQICCYAKLNFPFKKSWKKQLTYLNYIILFFVIELNYSIMINVAGTILIAVAALALVISLSVHKIEEGHVGVYYRVNLKSSHKYFWLY